jgi:hypothetical protein
VQVWFQNRRQKVKKISLAGGASTSNDTLSSAGERDSPLFSGAGNGGMPRNSSTGSFELLNAEFERLNHSPCAEPPGEAEGALPRDYRGSALPRAAAAAAGADAADGDDMGGYSLWTRGGAHGGGSATRGNGGEFMQPMPDNFSLTFQSLLGARIEQSGREDAAASRAAGAAGIESASLPALAEYRRQLMAHLAAVDPSLDLETLRDAPPGSLHEALPAGKQLRAAHYATAHAHGHTNPQAYDTLDAAASLLLFSATAAFLNGTPHASPTGGGVEMI